MTAPAALCGTTGCGHPAVAVVTVSAARISVRADRLADPRAARAWAEDLRCWGCVTAAVDQHIAGSGLRGVAR
ncbi:hypothetical protein AB0L22_08835 [Micromonospora haikouensis]|uniref:hypothetical protein n=1 Tax=Micromonospora haikouensis TaxID=686309 RepID=UPI00343B304B